jgi:hypothetical protein
MWRRKRNRGKTTVVENALALLLMGILAGAVGGLAVGVLSAPKTQSPTSAPAH